MGTVQTITFYLAVFAAALLLTRRSETTGRPHGLAAATLLLVLISGLRAYSVGVDTSLYQIGTEYFFRNGEIYWRYSFAYGYGVFTSTVLHIWDDYTVLLVIQALITNGLIAARFWDFRHGASLTFMMLGYLCTAYLMTLCIICQFVAVSIVFYFSRFLERGHPLLYLAGVALATSIHASGIISILAVLPFMLKFRGVSARRGLLQAIGCAALGAGLAFAWGSLVDSYSFYNTSARASSVGLMVFVQVFVLIGALLLAGYFKGAGEGEGTELRSVLMSHAPHSLFQYVVALGLSSSSYVIGNAGRISYYYILFGPVVYGVIAKQSRTSRSAFACSFLLAVWLVAYLAYVFFMHDGLGILSYSFFWW